MKHLLVLLFIFNMNLNAQGSNPRTEINPASKIIKKKSKELTKIRKRKSTKLS